MELRKDYILNRWVIIAPARSKRTMEYKHQQQKHEDKTCYFCPGNERLTPTEIGRTGTEKKWRFRWFANKFPAVDTKNSQKRHAYGIHEIIVETPSSTKQLWELNKKELTELFGIYKNRIQQLEKQKRIRYVTVFKNHGKQGGASLQHSHTQVIATAKEPPIAIEEAQAANKKGKCEYCKIIKIERKSSRKAMENKTAIAIAPYASRFNYELWIFPKKHHRKLSELSREENEDLTAILHNALKHLKMLDAPYNYFIHYSPQKENLHLHLEITPRIATWAGFEMATGITINTVPPEDAAKFYRKK